MVSLFSLVVIRVSRQLEQSVMLVDIHHDSLWLTLLFEGSLSRMDVHSTFTSGRKLLATASHLGRFLSTWSFFSQEVISVAR